MKFQPLHRTISDNSLLVIREASINDAEELKAAVKEYVEESEFVPYNQGEFQLSLKEEIEWIESFQQMPNSLLLIAEVNGKIVGNLSLNGNKRQQLQHTAEIGIGILREYRGKGIGKAFFEAVLSWTKEDPVLEMLILEAHADNALALKLYRKVGFEQVGILPRHIKTLAGNYADTIIMTMKIK